MFDETAGNDKIRSAARNPIEKKRRQLKMHAHVHVMWLSVALHLFEYGEAVGYPHGESVIRKVHLLRYLRSVARY